MIMLFHETVTACISSSNAIYNSPKKHLMTMKSGAKLVFVMALTAHIAAFLLSIEVAAFGVSIPVPGTQTGKRSTVSDS